MGFLDKVKETTNKVADQAKHATAVGKEKFDDVRLQKKISDLCQEIGALVVAQRRNEAPEEHNLAAVPQEQILPELEPPYRQLQPFTSRFRINSWDVSP